MDPIAAIFDRMDEWRHLPKYQLERRSDLFFSLYLPEVLEAKLGFPIRAEVTPEFPVRKATIYPHHQGDDCCNIDYLALSASGTESVFVELKTDQASRRVQQDDYLLRAQQVGLPALLGRHLQHLQGHNEAVQAEVVRAYAAPAGDGAAAGPGEPQRHHGL